jgi:hypothetical protein
LKKHHQHIQLEHLNQLTMAEHGINLEHCLQPHNSSILSTKLILYGSHYQGDN